MGPSFFLFTCVLQNLYKSTMSPPPFISASWIAIVSESTRDFARDSTRLLRRCTKPDRTEFKRVATRVGLGALCAGTVGFWVKLLFIPIRTLIL
jgi:protein transport protein SEC61 subunit gamma-like protein